jgi:hypothetical protein
MDAGKVILKKSVTVLSLCITVGVSGCGSSNGTSDASDSESISGTEDNVSSGDLTYLAVERRSNPVIRHMFTADPSAHVWDDGRLYVYPSTDVSPPRGYSTMDGYHVFSTDDLINWVDHGEILHSDDVEWGREDGGYMWAPDAAYKDGIYYFFYPHPSGDSYSDTWKIGVATSTSPSSGFEDQGYIEDLLPLIDPNVFIDDDGQAYLYSGGPGDAYGVKLADNMLEIDGEQQVIEGLTNFKEGLWVFKRNDIYYAIYPDNTKPDALMHYAMGDDPLGPYTYQGTFLDGTGVTTTHGSVVEYNEQWYLFYHNGELSGGQEHNRSIAFDPIYFNDDGTIQTVVQTNDTELPAFYQDSYFNNPLAMLDVGEYSQAELLELGIENNAISSIEVPGGYQVEAFEEDQFSGQSWLFETNYIDLSLLDADDTFSSMKVTTIDDSNLVENGSFEEGAEETIAHWVYSGYSPKPGRNLVSAVDGYYSLYYEKNRQGYSVTQTIDVEANTNYTLTGWMKIDSDSEGEVELSAGEQSGVDYSFSLSADESMGEWVEFTATLNTGDNTTITLVCSTSDDFSGVAYWDDISLIAK